MTKTKILRIYTLLSIVVGFVLFFYSISYVANFTKITLSFNQVVGEFYGNVDKTLMNVTFSIYGGELTVFNIISIIGLAALVVNIVFAILIGNTEETEFKLLRDVYQVNIIVSLAFFLGTLLFIFMIPNPINGAIVNQFLYVKMPIVAGETRYVINLMYVVSIFYVLYNILVLLKTLPESKSEIDEELYIEEFYAQLDSSETNKEEENPEKESVK